MSVGPDDHRGLFDLLRIIRFHNVNDIEPTQRGETMLPLQAKAFALDLVGHRVR